MKLKTILTISLAVCIGAGVTSCEDMLRVDSKTVMYDYQNTLDDPTDTVYSVLGIIKKMQTIADRTNILGEIRGDLVAVSSHASKDLRDLYDYDFKSLKDNKYDQALDYYSIINNCNFFLNQVDTTFTRNQQHPIMKGEYIVMLCYKAWAYLQLAQIYGEVPYFDKPITGDIAGNVQKLNIKEVAQALLEEFKGKEKNFIEYMDKYSPNYGKFGGEQLGDGSKTTEHQSKELFIPIRLILGDLYLWAEDYAHAALYYHDFLAGDNRRYTVGVYDVRWLTNDFLYFGPDITSSWDTYTRNIFSNNGYICYIPMEADQYSGTVTDLMNIYNSTEDNYYWYQLTRSRGLTATSVRQNYCYHAKLSADSRFEYPAYMANKEDELILLRRGDLRLQSVLETEYLIFDEGDIASSNYNSEYQTLNKINSEKIWLYRKDVVYLRLAEALNRCELPQTAFAILKSGLCKATIDSISQGEKLRAKNVNGVDISEIYTFATEDFKKAKTSWEDVSFSAGVGTTNAYISYWLDEGNTFGIHSRGCGDADYDPNYRIPVDTTAGRVPTLEDSIRGVEERLIDEMALETCFEGYRFGDLLRISMHRAQDPSSPGYGGFAENDFLARRVATRETAVLDDKVDYYRDMDMNLYNKLNGDGKSLNKSWFLVLPDEK
ncbi:MAG: RagB/SusD family nutrient uptake outer membrane protein [Bacteroidaceae bacterium]|nr:RagB/SusD family nutrient uptake outer membrane protein [Bacteroidaceae bacterium]